jgi:hypothetical protein
MKGLSIVGIILLAVSGMLFYFTTDFAVEKITMSHVMGMLGGIGIGLFIGGVIGYVSKGYAIKREQEKKVIERLKNDKYELQQKVNQQKEDIA